jgi:hypothetical protein
MIHRRRFGQPLMLLSRGAFISLVELSALRHKGVKAPGPTLNSVVGSKRQQARQTWRGSQSVVVIAGLGCVPMGESVEMRSIASKPKATQWLLIMVSLPEQIPDSKA